MPRTHEIVQLVYAAIEEVNRTLAPQDALELSVHTVITGGGKLDSLAFLNLAIGIEERVERLYGKTLSVTETALLADVERPVTVADLAEQIARFVAGVAPVQRPSRS